MFENLQITFTAARSGFESAAVSASPPVSIAPLLRYSRDWTSFIGPAISLLILGTVFVELRTIDYAGLIRLLPTTPAFWTIFVCTYLLSPVSEWIIFRRIWSLPINGFPPLVRKFVSNEILLGYLGEIYFYAWARRHAKIVSAPFGAIKDVTILSAVVGNIFTLGLVVVATPFFGALHAGLSNHTIAASAYFIVVSSLGILLFRRRLFTLPAPELWFVAAVHGVRVLASALLAAVMWHLLLPSIALSWWLLLGTLRQLLSRLPLLPNKDLVFAGIAAFLIGPAEQITAAMTLMATLILATHLIIGTALGAAGLVGTGESV